MYPYVDNIFSVRGVVPGEDTYKLSRKVQRPVDGGRLVFLGATLWWRPLGTCMKGSFVHHNLFYEK